MIYVYHICIYIHIYQYIHTYINICIYIHICIILSHLLYIYIYNIYTYTYICIWMYLCMHICMQVCYVCMYVCMMYVMYIYNPVEGRGACRLFRVFIFREFSTIFAISLSFVIFPPHFPGLSQHADAIALSMK